MDWIKSIFEKNNSIFLDYASATPVSWRARLEMMRYWSRDFYNPNAIYAEGERVKKEVEDYRRRIAKALGVQKDSVIFTSGGTEANVLAIQGLKSGAIVVDQDAHPSILDAAKDRKTVVLDKNGELEIPRGAVLISSVVPDNKLGRAVRELRKGKKSQYPLLHIDASQTAQHFEIGLEKLACDMLTLDSAKLYGPKGIGALVVRKGVKLELPPRGTPPVPLIAGFAVALEEAARDRESEYRRLDSLSAELAERISSALPEASVSRTVPNTVNISVPGILPELLVLALDREGVKVSAGPACNSNKPEPPETPVRFSLGRGTTRRELYRAAEILCRIVQNVVK